MAVCSNFLSNQQRRLSLLALVDGEDEEVLMALNLLLAAPAAVELAVDWAILVEAPLLGLILLVIFVVSFLDEFILLFVLDSM